MPRYMTINNVAKVYGLSEGFLRAMLKRGELPVVRSGNRNYVDTVLLFNALELTCKASITHSAAEDEAV